MAGQSKTRAGFFLVLFLLGSAVTGGAFYRVVLPKFQQPVEEPPPPPPPPLPLVPEIETSVPQIVALPGTQVVRLAYQTSNAHQAWGLANMGKVTDPGSIFARHGITLQLLHLEEPKDRIAALKAMAVQFEARQQSDNQTEDPNQSGVISGTEVHFFTIGGDSASWVIPRTNRALKEINPAFSAEIVGISGVSLGEDVFLGLPEWRANPRRALGAVVAAVPSQSSWNVVVFWAAQNNLPLNSDQEYYDPKALNLIEVDSLDHAAQLYIDEGTVERIFLANGLDYDEDPIPPGVKGQLALSGVAVRTPVDLRVAAERGGIVNIASTRQYPNQSAQLVVGLKQWNEAHPDVVANMLASVFEASQRIEKSQQELKAERLVPKSDADDRWQAAQYMYELTGIESPDTWYTYYDATPITDDEDLRLEVGGAVVANLQRNLTFFGLGEAGPDRGKVIYQRFIQFDKQYADYDQTRSHPIWDEVFNTTYVEEALEQEPTLAQTDPTLPTFVVERKREPQEFTYRISFAPGQETFTPDSTTVLTQVLEQIRTAGEADFEIHGHTDSEGSAELNLDLSRRRGEAVYNWLREQLGEAFPDHIEVVAHGEEDLLVQDQVNGVHIPELMAQNRRVVLKISQL